MDFRTLRMFLTWCMRDVLEVEYVSSRFPIISIVRFLGTNPVATSSYSFFVPLRSFACPAVDLTDQAAIL